MINTIDHCHTHPRPLMITLTRPEIIMEKSTKNETHKRLRHECAEWDFMLIDETSPEIIACTCTFADKSDTDLRDWYGSSPDSPHDLRSTEPTVIGDDHEATDIHPTDFLNDRGAPALLGREVEESEMPRKVVNLPLRADTRLNLEGLIGELRKEAPEEALVLYYGAETGAPSWLHSGQMSRKDVLWLLQTMIHRLMKEQDE